MGLMVHSLNVIPRDLNKAYYIYLLDYGWEGEPLVEAIKKNYNNMAALSSKYDAVVITDVNNGYHVCDEVMSWHNINGELGEDVYPAILITNENPHLFKTMSSSNIKSKIILIPLKKCCSNVSEVIVLINKIFNDIKRKEKIENFQVTKEMKKNRTTKRFLDGLILQPNFCGIGVDLKKYFP